jgi:rubrerythrin
MNKEKQIQEYESKRLIDELSKMPPMVIATAYLHAINYTLYGEDVTVRWMTATQNAKALEKAHRKGYYDALQRQAENEPMQVELTGDGYADGQIVYDWGKCPKCGWEFENGDKDWEEPYCCHCGQKLRWFEGGEQE